MLATIGTSMIPAPPRVALLKKELGRGRDFSGSDVAAARPLRRGRGI